MFCHVSESKCARPLHIVVIILITNSIQSERPSKELEAISEIEKDVQQKWREEKIFQSDAPQKVSKFGDLLDRNWQPNLMVSQGTIVLVARIGARVGTIRLGGPGMHYS